MKKLSFLVLSMAMIALVGCKNDVEKTIKLNPTKLTIFVGESDTIKALTTPESIAITWTSDNSTVATVENGVVTAVAAGEATITAAVSEEVKATCQVTVKARRRGIALDKFVLGVEIGGSAQIKATVYPTDLVISWESEEPGIATVANGVVTGVSEGKTVIVAKTSIDTAYCEVMVANMDTTIYSYFNVDGCGLFGEEFEPIPGTDTVLTLSDGLDYSCCLAYIYWYGWDGDLQYVSGSGWVGDGLFIDGGKVPVYLITSGEYEGYYVGTSVWTCGLEKDDEDIIPYNIRRGHVTPESYGDWVSYVYGDSIDGPIDQEIIFTETGGSSFAPWYTSEDFNYADYGLYYGFIQSMTFVEADEETGTGSSFIAELKWVNLTDEDRVIGFKVTENPDSTTSFVRPYDFESVENYVYSRTEEEQAKRYYLCSPQKVYREMPVVRGKSLQKDKFYMAR